MKFLQVDCAFSRRLRGSAAVPVGTLLSFEIEPDSLHFQFCVGILLGISPRLSLPEDPLYLLLDVGGPRVRSHKRRHGGQEKCCRFGLIMQYAL